MNRSVKVDVYDRENMLGRANNTGYTVRYNFFLYTVGSKSPPVFEGMGSNK